MRYRPEIDGLRAIAVVPVMLFHAGFQAVSGGFVGVDIFFVISGYLITGIILEDLRAGRFTLRRFYERRMRRILPALLVVALVCLPMAWMWMFPSEFKDFAQSLIAIVTFSSNVLFWRESGYFAPAAELKPLLHTWSLSVEEQFYVLFPLLLMAARRFGARVLPLACFMTVASFAASVALARHDPTANFYLIASRAWELGVGVLLALSGLPDRSLSAAQRATATILGMALIAFAMVGFNASTPFPGLAALVPVAGAALVIVGADSRSLIGRFLQLPLLVGIGLISYSLYLWHQPLLAFLRLRSLHEPPAWLLTAALLLATVLAILTWKFVELPFRNRQRMSSSAVARVSATGFALLAAIGIAGHASNGFANATPSRMAAESLQARMLGNYGLSPVCDERFTLAPQCRTAEVPEILVWGDSFAMHLVDGLRAEQPAMGLIQMTMSMCGPLPGIAPMDGRSPVTWGEKCLSFNRQVMEWLATHPGIRYVVVSSVFSQYLDPDLRYLTDHGAIDSDPALALQAFSRTLEQLQRIGVTPIVIAPPPASGDDMGHCLARSAYLGIATSGCDFPLASHERHSAAVTSFLRKIDDRFPVVWFDQMLCDERRCRAAAGDVLLYRDYGHLSFEGSAYLGAAFGMLGQARQPPAVAASKGARKGTGQVL